MFACLGEGAVDVDVVGSEFENQAALWRQVVFCGGYERLPVFVFKLHDILEAVVAVDIIIHTSAGGEDFIPLFRGECQLPSSLHRLSQAFQSTNRGAVLDQGIGVPNHHIPGLGGEHPGVDIFFFHEFEAAQKLLPFKEDFVGRSIHLTVPSFGYVLGLRTL